MRKKLLCAGAAILMTAPLAPCAAQVTIKPSVVKRQLKASPALEVQRVDLAALYATLPEATLEYSFDGDVAPITDVVYVDPKGKYRGVEFRTNAYKNSKVHAVRWQVTRAPFAGPIDAPAALIASGTTANQVFEIDFGDIARKAGLIVEASTAKQTLKPSVNTKRLRRLLDKADKSEADSSAPQVNQSPATTMTSTRTQSAPASKFYVRVIPVDPANTSRIVGKPSGALPVIWAEKPNQEVAPIGFEPVSQESFNLSFAGFTYHPSVTIERWPSGCEDIPRDDGADFGDVVADIPETVVEFVNWASEAYADLKNIVISIAADLLPFVPEEVLSIALDVAMASAGLPPSLPNVDQLMEGGADYLAVQMAAQIPTPASGVLAEMAAEEARAEIQRRTKEAILASAREIAKKRKNDTKWCTRYISDPYFEAKVRNKGSQTAENISLKVKANTGLLDDIYVPIEQLKPGEELIIPIAYREAKNVPWKWVSQMPEKDKEAALNQWWRDYSEAKFNFTFILPQTRTCYGDGRCDGDMKMVYKTVTRRWD
ncbi:MAG: hypothetical protein R3C58_13510 [Parvularculaceae bacterium]